MKNGRPRRTIRPYFTAYISISPSAPNKRPIGSIKIMPRAARITPPRAVAIIIKVKYSLARSLSPRPMVFATMAVPPVPSMKPKPPRIIIRGKIMLIAAKGVLPTKFDTKRPSTTPYIEVKIIITTVGMTNFISLP